MATPRIRRASADDIDAVSKLWLSMVNEFEPQNIPNRGWWIDRQAGLYNSGIYYQFIAEEEIGIIGMVDFLIIPEPSDGKIHAIGQQLYVLPGFRKTSIAGRLWKAAYKQARELAQVMDTTAYAETKPFWEKRGFKFYCYSLRKEVGLCQ